MPIAVIIGMIILRFKFWEGDFLVDFTVIVISLFLVIPFFIPACFRLEMSANPVIAGEYLEDSNVYIEETGKVKHLNILWSLSNSPKKGDYVSAKYLDLGWGHGAGYVLSVKPKSTHAGIVPPDIPTDSP
jgi:hypothetical protein